MFETNVRNRIVLLLKQKEYTVVKLAGGKGSFQAKLNKQIHGDTTISAETILLVLSTFQDVSAEWLLRGEGSMCKDKTSSVPNVVLDTMSGGQLQVGGTNNTMSQDDCARMQSIIEEKDARIAELTADKEYLKDLIRTITNTK